MMRIVNDQIRLSDAVAEMDDLDVAVSFPADTLVTVLAKYHRFAMLELKDVFAAGIAIRQRKPRAVIEDVAILQYLHVSRTPVCSGVFQRFFQVALKDVDGPSYEGSLGANRERNGIERPVQRTEWCRFCFLVELRSRRILPLRKSIDLIVEQQYLNPDIPAKHVNRVIAADGECVSVPGCHPDFQLRANRLQTRSYRWRPAVNGVETIGVHVIREAAGAADPGDDDKILFLNPKLRKNRLHSGENRVV